MSHPATTLAPSFPAQRPASTAPLAAVASPSYLIELARRVDRAGCPQAADFLVGAALWPVR